MREPTYFIMASLLDEPLHGYGIIKKAEQLSAGQVKLAAGTLYGALDRLVDQNEIVVDREQEVSGRRRRYYRLTETGEAAVAAEVRRMQAAIAAAGTRFVVSSLEATT